MAYIDAQTTAKIRKALKVAFPEIKFSVRNHRHSSISVTILASPYFEDGMINQINHYWLERNYEGDELRVLSTIDKIIRTVGGHYDNSDIMTDYFDVAFYYNINVGEYDKPHSNTNSIKQAA